MKGAVYQAATFVQCYVTTARLPQKLTA